MPGFLAIDESVYADPDFDIAAGHVMSPPYRTKEYQALLWQALQDGVLSTTGTDHCCGRYLSRKPFGPVYQGIM